MTEHRFLRAIRTAETVTKVGRIRRIHATYLEADGPNLPLGSICELQTYSGGPTPAPLAQVVGVNLNSITLAPFEDAAATFSGARVKARQGGDTGAVGDAFLGRAIDGLGQPIDGARPIVSDLARPLSGVRLAPLSRHTPNQPLETGIRAIDGLLTLGRGQRVGVFAAAGVGKTSLMAQLTRQVDADRCVICLVGERGREVENLWNKGFGPEARARSVLVAATSDQSAVLRVRAVNYALMLAEYWRDQGLSVLLVLDSVTRLAMALREIGLAAGEPPTVRAYTPGVFAAIPKIVERCGALKSGGAITAVMTVLSETDDVDDPISELMKSLLDGHIVLSRSLSEQGHFPAIDVTASVSRLASAMMSDDHRRGAEAALRSLSIYQTSRTLIETGIYSRGSNVEIDRALDDRPALLDFLRQPQTERTDLAQTAGRLTTAFGRAP